MLEKGIFVLLVNTMGSCTWSICQQSSECWDCPAVSPEEGLAWVSG